MKLTHHYTLKITCDPPPRAFVLGGEGKELHVITVHGDFQTVHEALELLSDDGSPLQQLERFEELLNAPDDPAGQKSGG